MRNFKPSILVVEDEEGVRNLIITVLRLGGFDALPCADAMEAMELLAVHGHSIELMVADVTLGLGLGGLELARSLREVHPHLQVLYISGLADTGPVTAEVNLGRARFLPKPFTPRSLLDAVKAGLPAAACCLATAHPAPRDATLS
ncbi:MAG TPA: response regulator [Fibrobacteria bacterium]|nr:response regulator [Fibrobacteria bacterium]